MFWYNCNYTCCDVGDNASVCGVSVSLSDTTGWWLIDVHGELGWAPASYLILKDEDEAEKEEEENEALVLQDRGMI